MMKDKSKPIWTSRKLDKVLRVQNGYAFDSKLFDDQEGVPLIRIRDLKTNSPSTRYRGNYEPRFIVQPGDYLIGMDGEFRCYKWDGPEGLLNQRVCRLYDFVDDVEPNFVLYGINFHLKAIEDETPFVTVKHISAKQIKAIDFKFPPLNEQRRIVTRIEELMERIEEALRLRSAAKQEVEGLVSATIENSIKGLETIQLKSVVESYRNGIYKKKQFYGKGFPSVRMYNIQDGKVVLDGTPLLEVTPGELEAYGLKPGDILINRVNSIELVGKAGLVGNDLGPCTFESKNIRLRVQRELVEPGYIVATLSSDFVKAQIQSVLKPAIGQATINQADLDNLLIPLPSINQQRRILKYLNNIQTQIEQLKRLQEETQAKLDSLTQSVLAKAFQGEL